MEYRITLPLKISVYKSKKTGKDTFFTLNLNQYRKASYIVLNNAKINFKKEISSSLSILSKFSHPIGLEFIVYPGSKRLCDISNICSIEDKFFCDALVELGYLEDDNYTIIKYSHYSFGNVDKSNPRCEVIIKELSND